MDQVKRAIINMFKEDGRTVTDITDHTVTAVGFREVTYNYEVIGDIVKTFCGTFVTGIISCTVSDD